MASRAYTVADFERVLQLRLQIARVMDESDASVSDISSALATFLVDIFTELLRRGDPHVAGEMKRMAILFTALADAAGQPDEIRRVAMTLCDAPNGVGAS